eukprot:contig_5367_g1208
MANYRRKAVTFPKGTILGIAELYEGDILTPDEGGQVEPLEVLAVTDTPEREEPDVGKPSRPPVLADTSPKDQEALKALAEADLDHLPPSVAEGVRRWGAPVVIVPKKDQTTRFCIDYRRLNLVTKKDSYPIPRMDECIDSLGEATVFTTIDCRAGYWQIP